MDGLVMAAGGVGLSVLAWVWTGLYMRLTSLLDDTAKELAKVAQSLAHVEGAHGARLDALERTL